jgi:hypothetical protein
MTATGGDDDMIAAVTSESTGWSGRRRAAIYGGAVVLVALAVFGYLFFFAWAPERRPGFLSDPIDPQLPDLSMAPLDVQGIAVAEDGSWRLRFGATIINIGEGDFMVGAYRRLPIGGWDVYQQIADVDGQYTEKKAPTGLKWGGDGHNHWHVRNVETHWVETLDGEEVGRVVKEGYCFFDTTPVAPELAGAPERPVYGAHDCGHQSETSLDMGLSVGWGDLYPWSMFEQQIDVTDIPDGDYRIRAVADPGEWFDEVDETNNGTWATIRVGRDADGFPTVEVLELAPPP